MEYFGLLATEEKIRVDNSIPTVDKRGKQTQQQQRHQQQHIFHSSVGTVLPEGVSPFAPISENNQDQEDKMT